MHGAPLEAGLGMAIFQAEAGSASTPCVIPRLGTPLRIAGLLSECLLVPPADTISVVTARKARDLPLAMSNQAVYAPNVSLLGDPQGDVAGVSKAKPRGHGCCRRE